MALYELAVLGSPRAEQLDDLKARLAEAAHACGLVLGVDLSIALQPAAFAPSARSAAAAVFFGGTGSNTADVAAILQHKVVPVLPVPSSEVELAREIPEALRGLNCLFYDKAGPERVASTLLGCVGLLRPQRRVFISYKRAESMSAATQLFAELSSRNFSVFLDTHSVPASVEFQEELWHQLADVDVVVMLDTASYFTSRWTAAEYGRALSKGIGVLRVQWPGTSPARASSTAAVMPLTDSDLNSDGTLMDVTVAKLCGQLEQVRCITYAARHLSAVTQVEAAITRIEGQVDGMGPHRVMHVRLPTGRQLIVQPIIGVPNSVTLQEAIARAGTLGAAIVYDHLGLKSAWEDHLHWLGTRIPDARWIRVSDAAWRFAGWETENV